MASRVLASRRPTVWLHLSVLALTFVVLLAWTWRRWPDVLIDFGHELYVPWRMLEGMQLFRDLAWFNGPLSPYWNAFILWFFGLSFTTLAWANVVTFACIVVLLHFVLRGFSSRAAATLACLTVMTTCGFGQLTFAGNYNFITPYSHGATHGTLLGLATLAAAGRFGARDSLPWLLLCGSCVGLAFLTKPEMFLAALSGAVIAVTLYAWNSRSSPFRTGLTFAVGLLLPIVMSWTLLRGALGSRGAWKATLGAWPHLVFTDVSQTSFYLWNVGVDRPASNTMYALVWAGASVALLVPGVLLAFSPRGARRRIDSVLAAIVATAIVWMVLHNGARWLNAPRPWPLFVLVLFALALSNALRRRETLSCIGAAAFAAFSFTMMGKMLLNARLYHYGFVLGMPAAAFMVVAAWDWVPARVEAAGGDSRVTRASVATVLALFVGIHLLQTALWRAERGVVVGSGSDRFVADQRGTVVNDVLGWFNSKYPLGTARPTVAALPEGDMLNYLGRLQNPTPYSTFMPPEVLLLGQSNMIDAFRRNPPRLILIVHRRTSEYGVPWFGRDYAVELWSWIGENYHEVKRFGDPPLRPGSRFGIDVLEHNHSQ